MKPGAIQPGERRGLFCPCGAPIGPQYIAQSYASPAGQYRMRVCRICLAEVETIEHVVGLAPEMLDCTGLRADQLRLIRQMLTQFRRENVTIEMRPAMRRLASS